MALKERTDVPSATTPEQQARIRAALAQLGRPPTRTEEEAIARDVGCAWRSVWAVQRAFRPGVPTTPDPTRTRRVHRRRPEREMRDVVETTEAPDVPDAPEPEPRPGPEAASTLAQCSACGAVLRLEPGEDLRRCPACGEVFG